MYLDVFNSGQACVKERLPVELLWHEHEQEKERERNEVAGHATAADVLNHCCLIINK
jgi:hypothetical protein